jgi:hypothetical protein
MKTANIKVLQGDKKILISAPHAYPHKRPALTCAYKGAEEYTDEMVKEICSNLNCYGIHLISDCEYDPNYHKEKNNKYKERVRDLIVQNNMQRVIDIHGLRDDSGYDVEIYYTTRFRRSINLAERIAKGLDKGALRGISIGIFRFPDNYQESIGEYVASKLRVPAIQIELEKYIRKDKKLRNEFIKNLSNILLEEKI